MTKWICKACTMGDCSAENLGWTPECLYGHRDLTPKWERVDEPPIKDCPPFKQDDEHEPRVRACMECMERIEKLEHQMRDHYHCRHGGTAYLNRVGWGDVNKEYQE